MTKGKFQWGEFFVWMVTIFVSVVMVILLTALALTTGCQSQLNNERAIQSSDLDFNSGVPGIIREIHGPTPCEPFGGVNPVLQWTEGLPKPGSKIMLTGVTRHGPNPPNEWMAMVISYDVDRYLFDAEPYGATGCWLLVKPDILLSPVPTTPVNHRLQVWGGNGACWLRWWPNASDVGLTMRAQLVVLAPGENRLHALSSNAVEVVVGQ